jgi:hypothetical protein
VDVFLSTETSLYAERRNEIRPQQILVGYFSRCPDTEQLEGYPKRKKLCDLVQELYKTRRRQLGHPTQPEPELVMAAQLSGKA